jgi:pimeloyl-ACP methyl ester carboxylesterase
MSADVTVIVWRVVGGQDSVLLLHGQPGSARDWERTLRRLGDDIITIALNRPGYDGLTNAGGIEHSAHAAIERMDSEGIERATIVGLSFGGGVAAWIAADYPERVSSLVLISAAANRAALYRVDKLLAAPFLGPLLSASMIVGASVVLRSPQLLRRRTIRAFLVEQRAMLHELPVLEDKLDQIEAPTTVVVGTADTVVSPDAGRLLAAQIPDATLVEIEGARHSLPATHPQRISELIRAAAVVVR